MTQTTATVHKEERWIALLGRRDEPTDGVEDYCVFLGRGLAERGVELERTRVRWDEKGWIGALQNLRRKSMEWRGRWVLLQYTALAWSRRGFPFAALAALVIVKQRGARCAVVFHEPSRQRDGARWIDRFRGACQEWVIKRLYRSAAMSIFTVPLGAIAWLPKTRQKATFIPIGANIPVRDNRRYSSSPANAVKTVVVFGVTGMPDMWREVGEIADVVQEASKTLAHLRLVVIGRGSTEARELLVRALGKSSVELVVRGILPAEDVARELGSADVLLFVRGAITPQRGSAIAGMACGLPIVGYQNGDISDPLKDAGVEWSPWGDRNSLARGLVRLLTDPARWTELHCRNVELQKSTLSWDRIADRYRMVLAE